MGLMLAFIIHTSTHAEPTKGYYTMDAMGFMWKECTNGVEAIYSSGDLRAKSDSDWDNVDDEFDEILSGQIGVDVHLADEKYFPVGHRGVYHTVSNHFYLNKTLCIVHMYS